MSLFTRHAAPEPDPFAVDPKLAAELTAALDQTEGWERRDGDSFVSAGRTDGSATVVGNSGGWRLVRCGPGDKPMAEPVASARDAVAQATPAVKR